MIRQSWRSIRRSRGIAVAAVLTLSVGMAGALSMFTLIRGVLLRPLPVSSPDSLVAMWKELPRTRAKFPVRAAEIDPLRDAGHVFSSVATIGYNDPAQVDLIDGEVTRVRHSMVGAARGVVAGGYRSDRGGVASNRGDAVARGAAL